MTRTLGVRVVHALLLGALASLAASAQDVARLRASPTFRCAFASNATADMRGDVPRASLDREQFELVFDQVSVRNGSGRMIGNAGGVDVRVIEGDAGITLIEPLESGFLQITAIYAAQNRDGRFKAVHSRHSAFTAMPIPSQYYGSCAALR